MTLEEQELAICELCPACTMNEEGDWVWANHPVTHYFHPLKDLNAMHEAEMTLTDKQFWPDYYDNLSLVTGNTYQMSLMIRATAAQRAEAFLRTIGKWKES